MTAMIDHDTERRDALVGRLVEAAIGTLDVFCIYVGDRLGLYSALADLGSATSSELAAASGTRDAAYPGLAGRPPTLRGYAQEAGFRDVRILPIENDFWRFYRLIR